MTGRADIFGTRGSLWRQYAGAAALFLALILGIIFLYGHLLAGSLSRRYLEDVLAGVLRAVARRVGAAVRQLGAAEPGQSDPFR